MSVFRNLDCLSLVVCSNTTLLKLQTVLFLFFSKFCASKSGVRLIHGCGLYTDVYGKYKKCGVKDAIQGTSFITKATLFGNFMI